MTSVDGIPIVGLPGIPSLLMHPGLLTEMRSRLGDIGKESAIISLSPPHRLVASSGCTDEMYESYKSSDASARLPKNLSLPEPVPHKGQAESGAIFEI